MREIVPRCPSGEPGGTVNDGEVGGVAEGCVCQLDLRRAHRAASNAGRTEITVNRACLVRVRRTTQLNGLTILGES